MKERTV